MSFAVPVADISFWLRTVAGLDGEVQAGTFPDLSDDLIDAVLTEAGRFATEEIAPLNTVGDREGARIRDGVVTMPTGWREVYRRWAEGGWVALSAEPAHGGQGLPVMLYAATLEMWNAASSAFATGPMLSIGAIEALQVHGTPEQQATFLPHLVAGTWTGTMNLTEPQAGSDLGALRTRAEPAGDGSYRLFGSKIYISFGEHDLAENIVHLVLARLPDAPPGTRGISLFLVPKILPNPDGTLGARNDVKAVSLEHKLGLHASPTCVMQYGETNGAIGWMVGEPNRGLAAMFTMMNNARLAVAVQGVGVAERAYQHALAYARERRQGRAPGATEPGMSPIIEHPDVRRMLLEMRALTDAARALCFALAHAIDRCEHGPDAERGLFADRAALLTPIAKAFATDTGVHVASVGIQVHGGMGYVEETGAAQFLRDARVFPIYEGTNGIQAIDLVTRKLPLGEGNAVHSYVSELRAIVDDARALSDSAVSSIADRVSGAIDDLNFATAWFGRANADGRVGDALAGATPYLRLFALAAGGAYHLKAVVADRTAGTDTPAARRRAVVARFFATSILPETTSLRIAATVGADMLDAATGDLFSA